MAHRDACFECNPTKAAIALRGRPVIVAQTPTDSAAAIAASYAAKEFGIKTGTPVREARRLCPTVIPVQANHPLHRVSRAHSEGRGWMWSVP